MTIWCAEQYVYLYVCTLYTQYYSESFMLNGAHGKFTLENLLHLELGAGIATIKEII